MMKEQTSHYRPEINSCASERILQLEPHCFYFIENLLRGSIVAVSEIGELQITVGPASASLSAARLCLLQKRQRINNPVCPS